MPEPTDLQRVAQWAKSSNAPSDVYNAACRLLDEMEAIRGGAEKLLNLSIDEGRRANKAEAALKRVRVLHPRDDSNPRGPWCPTCMVPWPCRTLCTLDGAESNRDGRTTQTLGTGEGHEAIEAQEAAR